eukprot:3350031-Pleurochrysis_carterae.AAC.1
MKCAKISISACRWGGGEPRSHEHAGSPKRRRFRALPAANACNEIECVETRQVRMKSTLRRVEDLR